jgi:hypothetical protein
VTNTTGRTFGVEIETVGLSEDSALAAIEGVVSARRAQYSSRDYSAWSVKGDGSLESPNGMAAEIVSPVMTWGDPDHYAQVERVTRALREAGARVNETCGLHVHVGASDLSRTELMGVVKAYTSAQDSIDHNISPDRDSAQWAKTWPSWEVPAVRYAEMDWNAMRDTFITGGYMDRYMTVNLAPFADRGTVEFRQHHGTLNPRSILAWAGLCVSLVKLGSEVEHRETWAYRAEAGQDWDGVYAFLKRYDSLDQHAEAFRFTRATGLAGAMAAAGV